MKKNTYITSAASFILSAALLLSAACAASAASAAPVLAASAVSMVSFKFTIDGDSAINEGYNDAAVEIPVGSNYDISDFSCTSDTAGATGKTALSYSLELSARRNSFFPAADNITVNAEGISSITKVTRSSNDNTMLTIKFKAYPYFQLAAPDFETPFDNIKGSRENADTSGRESTLTIDKHGAPRIEYVIGYFDQDGEYRTKSGSTTGSNISVSSYNKRYTGSNSSKRSCYIRGIAIRAAGKLGSNDNTAPSRWVYIDGGLSKMDTEEYFEEYTSWDEFLTSSRNSVGGSTQYTGTGTGASSVNISGIASPASGSSASGVSVFTWQGSGNTWYYYGNGQKITGWIFDGSNWYYCDPAAAGMMRTGWLQDGGYWYFLNTNHDGTFGKMLTGWIRVGGETYYLRPEAGGPMGSMVTGTVKINDRIYNFASSGALIG